MATRSSPPHARRAEAPAIPKGGAWLAAALIGGAAALLPMWDALERLSLLSALAGSGLGASADVPMPLGLIGYPALGLLIAVAVRRTASGSRDSVVYVLAAAALWMAGYAFITADHTACTRSHAIDSWNLCEHPELSPSGYGAYVSKLKHRISFDGPHLDNGDPCVHEDEHREIHLREHPDGDLGDGLVQIGKRFPKDRARVLGGTLAAFGAFAAGALMLLRRRRAT